MTDTERLDELERRIARIEFAFKMSGKAISQYPIRCVYCRADVTLDPTHNCNLSRHWTDTSGTHK